jgi:multiple sugar transport system substrate-binding protein
MGRIEITRRSLLGGLAGMSAASWLSSCSGGLTGGGGGGGGGSDTLSVITWASDAEAAVFRELAKRFQADNDVTVDLQIVPFEEVQTTVDAQIQGGTPPDVFRVTYTDLGRYSTAGQLLDVSEYVDEAAAAAFIPAFWQAVQTDGKPYGVPHHTDTTAIVYRPELLRAAGVRAPDSLESAWTWEEFDEASTLLRRSLPAGVAPFVYDWQQFGAYRWLTWLFAAGGRLLTSDLSAAAVDSAEGLKALEFTQRFFADEWVPRNTSVKSNTYPDAAFIGERVAMAFVGDFLLPGIEAEVDFDYQATFQPRDVRASSDLGGNALVATAESSKPDLAGAFLTYMVEEDNMARWCARTTELPTLQSLVGADIEYDVRPDLMPVFVEQATTLTEEDVEQVTVPTFSQINTVLLDELELAFLDGQSAEETLRNISEGVDRALGG